VEEEEESGVDIAATGVTGYSVGAPMVLR
jgi:hypothetical protein